MALMPGVSHRLIARHNDGAKMAVYNRVNLHVAVSEAASLYGYFSKVADCSHFYVAKDGTIEQYIDTAFRSKADYNGNDATISIETQGGVTNAQGEPWTEAQLASLASIWAWARDTHRLVNKIAVSSVAGIESKGLSWHRLGVPARKGDTISQTGGILYSKSAGKICPGNAKIGQVPEIFARANGSTPTPGPTPTPTPTPQPPIDGRPRNADGSLKIDEDGSRGPATIARWQEVMAFSKPDGKTSSPQRGVDPQLYLIGRDQAFLNSVVPAGNIHDLTGKSQLDVDAIEGKSTIKVRQFWLFNKYAQARLGRPARLEDFDGIAGRETTILHQYALNRATSGTRKY